MTPNYLVCLNISKKGQWFLVLFKIFLIFFVKKLVRSIFYLRFALSFENLAYGVTGNTFVFGTKEYRFETYWANII